MTLTDEIIPIDGSEFKKSCDDIKPVGSSGTEYRIEIRIRQSF